MGQTISASYNPSVSGLPGSVGDIVAVAGGATAWVKFGTGITDWTAFPPSGLGVVSATLLSDAASISCDVSALGDGDYAFEFEGATSLNAFVMLLKANGADLSACHSVSTMFWTGVGTNNLAGTTGQVYDGQQARAADATVSVQGRFSSRNGALSGFSSQYNSYIVGDAFPDKGGIAKGFHTPDAALTAIAIAVTAGLIRAGATLRVTRLRA